MSLSHRTNFPSDRLTWPLAPVLLPDAWALHEKTNFTTGTNEGLRWQLRGGTLQGVYEGAHSSLSEMPLLLIPKTEHAGFLTHKPMVSRTAVVQCNKSYHLFYYF